MTGSRARVASSATGLLGPTSMMVKERGMCAHLFAFNVI